MAEKIISFCVNSPYVTFKYFVMAGKDVLCSDKLQK